MPWVEWVPQVSRKLRRLVLFYHGKYGSLRKLRNCQPRQPTRRRMRSIQQIFAHAVSSGSQCAFRHTGENFESTALGVERVLWKVRGERHRAAWSSSPTRSRGTRDPTAGRAGRFRNTFQNPGVADLDFSPVGNESQHEAQPCTWARNRIIGHGFCGGKVWFRLGLAFLTFRRFPCLPW